MMQMVVTYFFFNAHWGTVTANLSASVAADISVAVQLYKQDPSESRAESLDAMLRPNMELSVALEENDSLPITNRRAFFSALDSTLRRSLDQALSDPFWFDTTRYPNHIDIRVEVDVFLAGVSHDLRTPLTRLKLFLALQDETEDVSAAKRDVKDMETMLNGYLDFARGLTGETAAVAPLRPFLETLIEKMDAPKAALHITGNPHAPIKPLALERAVTNLLNNAQGFADTIELTAAQLAQTVIIDIDDNGPGIPKDEIEDALKPFNRLDPSRNQNRDGVGLGLSITRDIVQSHGGVLSLSRSDLGGLKARISLPI